VCISANISIGFVENSKLYHSTSKTAIKAGIASATGIPFVDVKYEQNPDDLCAGEVVGKRQL
jgi:hypothetical protein